MTGRNLRHRNLAFLEDTAGDFLAAVKSAGQASADRPPQVPSGPPAVTSRVCIEPPRPDGRHPYLTRFVESVVQATREHEIPLFPMPTFTLSAALAIVGNVTPDGLAQVMRQTGCVYLIVIVPDPGEFLAGLDIVDWPEVDGNLRARGGRIHFALSKTPEAISAAINLWVSGTAPFVLDGLTVLSFDKPDLTRAVADTMTRHAYRALTTLGTFYDGCLMVRNTETNLRHGPARIYCNAPRTTPALPAWVVGSGPSLDTDMAFIRAHQDKAVIISCGSALSALTAGGVTPDFHIELENLGVAPALKPALAHDLSGITLVAPASVDPVVLDTFREIVFCFRQNLPNQPLYGVPPTALPAAGEPTVANLGLAVAREFGFPRVCLFGIDMGARDPSCDHAAGTWHRDPTSDYAGVPHPHRVPANFGGDCFTTPGLLQALHALAVTVAADRGNRDYVNCSDGAAIAGARPVRATDLDMAGLGVPKTKTVEAIRDALDVWDPASLPAFWPGPDLMATISPLIAGVREDLAKTTDFGGKGYLAAAAERLRFSEGHVTPAPPGPQSAARMLVRGAVGSLLLFMEYYLNRVTSQAHMATLGAAARAALDRELVALELDAQSWVGGTTLGPIPDFEDIRTPPDAKFFDPPGVPRNAPCPCGSGKRFKQCHGRTA